MITENSFRTFKTARFYTLGNPENQIEKIWFVFHGFGQLAKEFIQNFEIITDSKTLIVAPEALNKFYIRGFTGKIGATWMTKEDRENEIEDYIKMIDQVYDEISQKVNLSKTKINVLGFSQGGQTSARWLNKKNHKVNTFVLWGSSLPKEINYNKNLDFWNNRNLKLIVGDKDRFITEDRLKEEIEFINSQNINYELITYQGDHSINEYILTKIDKLI